MCPARCFKLSMVLSVLKYKLSRVLSVLNYIFPFACMRVMACVRTQLCMCMYTIAIALCICVYVRASMPLRLRGGRMLACALSPARMIAMASS